MQLHQTTPIPNEIFDLHFPHLSHAELRILLIIVRQTYGWKDVKTGKRKERDRMTYGFLMKKTGLYRTVLSQAIQSLIIRGLLIVSDYQGNSLMHPHERQGKQYLYYQPVRNFNQTYSQSGIIPIRNSEHNKRKTIKKKSSSKEALRILEQWKRDLGDTFSVK